MRAPTGGDGDSFCTRKLAHGSPATMILEPELVPPRRIAVSEVMSKPDGDDAPELWQLQPPSADGRSMSGWMSTLNDTSSSGSESSFLQLPAKRAPTSGSSK